MKPVAQLPGLQIAVDGAPLPAEYGQVLDDVCVQQRLSLPTLCELTFCDPRGALAGAACMLPGCALRVALEGATEPLFSGEVTALDYEYSPAGSQIVRVRASDRLHRLRKHQPVATYIQVTLAELARELLCDHGITVAAAADTPVQRQLVQFRQSDLELLADLAARYGLYFSLWGDALQVFSLEGIGAARPLTLGANLLEARVEVNSERLCRRVDTRSWDPWLAQSHGGQVEAPRAGRQIELELSPGAVGGSGRGAIANEITQDDRQAEAIAQGELDRRFAAEIGLRGMAEGDPGLRPGTPVAVAGIAGPLAGRYVLTETRHTIDAERGYVTEFSTLAPPAPARPGGVDVTLGLVSRVDDPQAVGRVKVSLPSCGDVESDWLGVLLPGAGKGKGLVALPDVGDTVLVLFSGGDPAQALVLGGLYGACAPPDAGVEDGAVQRYTLVTPGRQRIQLDDAKGEVRIDNRNGNFLQLSPDGVRVGNGAGSRIDMTGECLSIHSKTPLEIEAPGQSVVIRGASIDFERA